MPSFSRSRIAAKIQNIVAKRREESGLYKEIAEELPLVDAERLLDVGTGSGLQLKVIHKVEPKAEAPRGGNAALGQIKEAGSRVWTRPLCRFK